MEHIEEAGIHSGDSACALPPYSLSPKIIDDHRAQVKALANELGVVGLMNAQFAVKGDEVYVLEVNPRASRTVPFVSKATGQPLAKIAARVMVGRTLAELGVREIVPRARRRQGSGLPVREVPRRRHDARARDALDRRGHGHRRDFPMAFAKAQIGAGTRLPTDREGAAFISVRDEDKPPVLEVARRLRDLGFRMVATHGTAAFFRDRGVAGRRRQQGRRRAPALRRRHRQRRDRHRGQHDRRAAQAIRDSFSIRRTALIKDVPYFTTIAAARAAALAIASLKRGAFDVRSLQEYHS